MQIENRNTLGLEVPERLRIGVVNLPERLSVHEVEIHIDVCRLPGEARVTQPPLSARVFARHPPNGEPFTGKDRLGRLLDPGTVRQHVLALQRADVVEIGVHGQPRMAEDEQIQGSAAERSGPPGPANAGAGARQGAVGGAISES